MDKKNIKDLLKNTFIAEADNPGLAVTKAMHKKSGKVNKDSLKDVNKKVADFEKGVKKDTDSAEMPQNKFNYADDFQKDYHDQMEILNGMEMVKYDSVPEEQFVKRALEGIEGSSQMGNNPEWANVVPKQQGFSGPEFGKELVKRIKNSVKLRGEETPAVDLRGKDIQELPTEMKGDNGSKPTAYTKGVIPGKNLKESIPSKPKVKQEPNTPSNIPADVTKTPWVKPEAPKVKQEPNPSEGSMVEMASTAKPVSDKNKMVLTNWVQKLGANGAAEKLINQLSATGIVSDLPDSMEYGQGLNKIAALLAKQDFDNAVHKARALAKKLENKAMRDMMQENNNQKQIKESMKRLTFKNEFKGLGNALKLIPEGYKVDNKVFEMTDGNETYRLRWEGNLSEGKAVVLLASDKKLVNEDITRMKQLFGYKSQDTLGLVKGNARIDENRIFGDIWAKTKNLMTEGEDIENAKADEKPWEKEKKSSSEASAHVQGSVAKDKKTEAPKPKEGEWEETTKKAPEATAHVSKGKGTTLGAKPKEGNWEDVGGGEKMMEIEAPTPKEGEWEQISVPQAPEAKAHVEGSVSTDDGTQAPKPKEGEWDQISVPQAADAKKHITMKENEDGEEVMDEEFDIMNEEPMEEDVDKLMETMMSEESEEEKTEE
jgi:hypothetical protein